MFELLVGSDLVRRQTNQSREPAPRPAPKPEPRRKQHRPVRSAPAPSGGAPPGGWLRGRGGRSGDWSPPVEPTRAELDAIAPDRPVALMARDSHSGWLNSAALARVNGD